jgi:uncharacterized protein (DUF1778 family)
MARNKRRDATIPVRLSDQEIALIEAGAQIAGEPRSEFLRNSAKERASRLVGGDGADVAESETLVLEGM